MRQGDAVQSFRGFGGRNTARTLWLALAVVLLGFLYAAHKRRLVWATGGGGAIVTWTLGQGGGGVLPSGRILPQKVTARLLTAADEPLFRVLCC